MSSLKLEGVPRYVMTSSREGDSGLCGLQVPAGESCPCAGAQGGCAWLCVLPVEFSISGGKGVTVACRRLLCW